MGSQIGSQIGRKKRSVMYMNGMTMTTAPHSYGMGMPMMPTYARPYSPQIGRKLRTPLCDTQCTIDSINRVRHRVNPWADASYNPAVPGYPRLGVGR